MPDTLYTLLTNLTQPPGNSNYLYNALSQFQPPGLSQLVQGRKKRKAASTSSTEQPAATTEPTIDAGSQPVVAGETSSELSQYPITTRFKEPGSLWLRGWHPGIDYGVPENTPMSPRYSGTVVNVGNDKDYGNYLDIKLSNGFVVRYAHANRILVSPGDLVGPGKIAFLVGQTGKATGPHVHEELHDPQGNLIDPLTFGRIES